MSPTSTIARVLFGLGLGLALVAAPRPAQACNQQPNITVDGSPTDWDNNNYCEWQVTDSTTDVANGGNAGDNILGFEYTHSGTNNNFANVWLMIQLAGAPNTGVTYQVVHPGNAASGGAESIFTTTCTSATNCTTTVRVIGGTNPACNANINNVTYTTRVGSITTGTPPVTRHYIEMGGQNFPAGYFTCFDNTSYVLSVFPTNTPTTIYDTTTLSGTSPNNFIGSTAIHLLHFAHASAPGGERIVWQTGAEDGTIGFEIRRGSPTGPRVARVRAKAAESPVGASYEALDPEPARGTKYFLVELSRQGPHAYGPAEHNAATLPVRPGTLTTRVERKPFRPVTRASTPPGDAFARVTSEGLYTLDSAALATVGLASSPLAFTFDGAARPLFRTSTGWMFYAPAPIATDRADDAYHLTFGRHLAPATIAVRSATARGPATFVDTSHLEQHLQLDPGAPPDARFPWATVANGWPAQVSVDAPGLQDATRLSIEVRGQIDFGVAIEHHVQASLNGVPLIDGTWGGTASASFTATVPAGTLLPSGNVLDVTSPGDPGLPYDLFSLVSVDLTGPRSYRAQNDALGFTAAPNQIVQLTGFSAKPTVVDVTNPAAPQLLLGGATTQAADGTFGLGFAAPNVSGHRYYAAVPRAPALAAARANEVPSGSAQWVAITADGLGSALAPLVSQRQAQGLTTLVVDVEALNDAFGNGEHGPAAIQKYLAQLSPAPQSVLLVGKPSVDPHDYLQTGVPDALPSVIVLDTMEPSYAITDSALVAGADGRTPFAAIGRLPVRDANSLSAWVQKLVGYEQTPGTPSGAAVWAADGTNPATLQADPFFATESDRLAALFPLSAARVYEPAQGRSDLLNALAAQPDLVSYHGHADGLDWSTSGLLSYSDVPTLPIARPFLLVTVDCWDGMFAMPTFDPISQQLAQLPNGGAIAALASSTLVDESLDVQLDGALFKPLEDPSVRTAGDLVLHAQQNLAAMTGPASDLVHAYNLIGDPATPLPTR